MFVSLSPSGASLLGGVTASVQTSEIEKILLKSDWSQEDLEKVKTGTQVQLPRLLKSRERLDGYLRRNPQGYLKQVDRHRLVGLLPTTEFRGLKRAAIALFRSKCHVIRTFLRVWSWLDTTLCLAFESETSQVTQFKVNWWIIVAHDVSSSGYHHYVCKKWGQFCLYLSLHYGGSIQPTAKKEDWFPTFPSGTWLCKEPGTLNRKEKALCRILADKRGLPAGDSVTSELALAAHLQVLTKGSSRSEEQYRELRTWSEVAARSVKDRLKGRNKDLFDRKSGHVSISNSACIECSRSEGGKRAYVLKCLREWLEESPLENKDVLLPTGEAFLERAGKPRWQTVRPDGMDEAQDLPGGHRVSTGLLSEDFADGEQERVGFQLFCWSFATLKSGGYLDQCGQATGKPLPVTRVAIGEPGCKVRVATKTVAAYIVFGQPFAHAMREILEVHPGLRAGLSSGYQLHEWLRQIDDIPEFVMVGDFESATDHIEHRAGMEAMTQLLEVLGANRDGYAFTFLRLLFSPRRIEEDGFVTITNSGCLMGEPGTKIVLTFLALVANCYAHKGEPSSLFATAGDDQIDASVSSDVLLRYAEASRITTMVPSMDKWGIFRYSCVYCQQLLDIEAGEGMAKEISVPKPRLLSPESKQLRGDEDTNPAYGKARLFKTEAAWCEFPEIVTSMTLLFLRKMHQFIEARAELFLPIEWGGLGLPTPNPAKMVRFLSPWHEDLIHLREQGDPGAGKILSNWSSNRNLERGLERASASEYRELLSEYLPTADITEIELETGNQTVGYRQRLKLAKQEGWLPLEEVLSTIELSQTFKNIWDQETKVSRGYKTIPWGKRSDQMEKAAKLLNKEPSRPTACLVKPRWRPRTMVLALAGAMLEDGSGEEEEGGITETIVPILGTVSSPRLFLHYDNRALLLARTTKDGNYGQAY